MLSRCTTRLALVRAPLFVLSRFAGFAPQRRSAVRHFESRAAAVVATGLRAAASPQRRFGVRGLETAATTHLVDRLVRLHDDSEQLFSELERARAGRTLIGQREAADALSERVRELRHSQGVSRQYSAAFVDYLVTSSESTVLPAVVHGMLALGNARIICACGPRSLTHTHPNTVVGT